MSKYWYCLRWNDSRYLRTFLEARAKNTGKGGEKHRATRAFYITTRPDLTQKGVKFPSGKTQNPEPRMPRGSLCMAVESGIGGLLTGKYPDIETQELSYSDTFYEYASLSLTRKGTQLLFDFTKIRRAKSPLSNSGKMSKLSRRFCWSLYPLTTSFIHRVEADWVLGKSFFLG